MNTVIVYEHFGLNRKEEMGKLALFTIGQYDGNDLEKKGIGVNRISSLEVPEGLQVEVFPGQHYDGKSFIFYHGEYENLGWYGWQDNIGSLIVKEAPPADQLVTLYNGENRTNIYQRFPISQNGEVQSVGYNDAIKCIHIPVGLTAILYEHYNGGGESFPKTPKDTKDEVVNLSKVNFADRCSSIKVLRNPTKVRLIQVEYHMDKKVPKGSKELARVTQTLLNNSANATVKAPVSYSETVGWEISSSWENSLMTGAEVSVESGLGCPIVDAKTTVTISTEYTHTWGHNETSSGETTFEGGLEVELPPKSGAVEAITTIIRESYEVPYTATVEIKTTGERRKERGTLLVKNSFDVQTEVKDKQD